MQQILTFVCILSCLFTSQIFASETIDKNYVDSFDAIYAEGGWSNNGSGSGSIPKNAAEYIKLLQIFFNHPRYNKIVDLGCGDWQIMRTVSIPDDTQYTGYDVSTIVVGNNKKFIKQNVEFYHTLGINDFVQKQVSGDLIIVKDVLQHMPNEDIEIFIKRVLPNFKYALITNDFKNTKRHKVNSNITVAGYRPLDLRKPPFNLQNVKVLLEYNGPQQKRVVLYTNPN